MLVPLLRQHLADYLAEEPAALVSTGPKGGRLRRNNFGKLVGWSEALAAVGAPGLHFHDLRHTGNAFAAKVPGTTIRDLMGPHRTRLDPCRDDLPTRLTGCRSNDRQCLAGGVRRRI